MDQKGIYFYLIVPLNVVLWQFTKNPDLEDQSDRVLHCLFSHMRAAVVVAVCICSRY